MADEPVTPQPAATPAEPQATPPTPPQQTRLDMEGIPEELRGMSVQDFSRVWDLTRQALSAQQYAAQQPQPQVPPEPKDDRSLAERLADPESTEEALQEWANKTYGGLFDSVAKSSQEGTFASLRSEVPDFADKYEKRTREVISNLRVPATQVTPDVIRHAYWIARGQIAEEDSKRSKPEPTAITPEPPTPRPPTPPKIELSTEQREIAARLGMSEEKYAGWLSKQAGYQTMDVPLEPKYERGKAEANKG